MYRGYVKDYRKLLDSDVWGMPPMYERVWHYLTLTVNHHATTFSMNDGSEIEIQPGQHLTSIRNICKAVAWREGVTHKEPNPKTIKTILSWFEKKNMITVSHGKGNRQYTLITLLNWGLYQSSSEEGNTKVTAEKQMTDINKNVKNKKPSCPKFETCDLQSAKYLFSLIQNNNPTHKEPNFDKWANDFRLIRERDKRTLVEIKNLIDWSQNDDFWRGNILSPSTLRKQWDKLTIKMLGSQKTSNNTNTNQKLFDSVNNIREAEN